MRHNASTLASIRKSREETLGVKWPDSLSAKIAKIADADDSRGLVAVNRAIVEEIYKFEEDCRRAGRLA